MSEAENVFKDFKPDAALSIPEQVQQAINVGSAQYDRMAAVNKRQKDVIDRLAIENKGLREELARMKIRMRDFPGE